MENYEVENEEEKRLLEGMNPVHRATILTFRRLSEKDKFIRFLQMQNKISSLK